MAKSLDEKVLIKEEFNDLVAYLPDGRLTLSASFDDYSVELDQIPIYVKDETGTGRFCNGRREPQIIGFMDMEGYTWGTKERGPTWPPYHKILERNKLLMKKLLDKAGIGEDRREFDCFTDKILEQGKK